MTMVTGRERARLRRPIRIGTVLAGLCLLAVESAGAHHSPALYDLQQTVTLVGSVVRFEWVNPHAYVHMAVDGADEAGAVWQLEAGSPTMMELNGWSAGTLRPGERITVEMSPARNRSRRAGMLLSLRRADGTVLLQRNGAPARQAAPAAVTAADSLAGNWLPATPEFLRFVGPTEEWPLTDRARAALASHTDAENGSQNCVSLSAPFLMAWSDLKQIELRGNTAIVRAALIDAVERVVRIGADAGNTLEPTNQGHSTGRWDGGALVVETTGFSEHASGIRAGVPSSRDKHLTERFELSADRTRLTYSYTLEDPAYLTKPVTGRVEWVHRPDLEYTGYACDREVARRFLAQ
jgi:hypothetical protein